MDRSSAVCQRKNVDVLSSLWCCRCRRRCGKKL